MAEEKADVPMTRVFAEQTVYDDPWVRLVQVEIEPPDGRRFWHDAVRLRTVANAVVLDDDAANILMLRRHRFITGEVGWELPGGIVSDDESPARTAARETREETGWLPRGEGRRLIGFQPMPGMVDTPHEVVVFDGADLVGEPTDSEEAGVVEWIRVARIRDLVREGEVLGAGSLVGLLAWLAGVTPQTTA